MPPKRAASPAGKKGAKAPPKRAASTSPAGKKEPAKGKAAKAPPKRGKPKPKEAKGQPETPQVQPFTVHLVGEEWLEGEKIHVIAKPDETLEACVPPLTAALQVKTLEGLTFSKLSKVDGRPIKVPLTKTMRECKLLADCTLYVSIDHGSDLALYLMSADAACNTFDEARRVFIPLDTPIEAKLPEMRKKLSIPSQDAHLYTLLWAQGVPQTGVFPTNIGVAVKKTPKQLSLSGAGLVWFGRIGDPEVPSITERAAQTPLPVPLAAEERAPSAGALNLISDGVAFDVASRWRLGQYKVEKDVLFDEDDVPMDPPEEAYVARLQEKWRDISPHRAHRDAEARRVAAAYPEAELLPKEKEKEKGKGSPKSALKTPKKTMALAPEGWRARSPGKQMVAFMEKRRDADLQVTAEEAKRLVDAQVLPEQESWLGDDPNNFLSDHSGAKGYARAFRREGDRAMLDDPRVLAKLQAARDKQLWEEMGGYVREVRLEGTVEIGAAVTAAALALAVEMTRRMWWAPQPVAQIQVKGIQTRDPAASRYHAAVARRRKVLREVLCTHGSSIPDELRATFSQIANPTRESLLNAPDEAYEHQNILHKLQQFQQAFTVLRAMPTLLSAFDEQLQKKIGYFLDHPLRESRRHRRVWEEEERREQDKATSIERELFSASPERSAHGLTLPPPPLPPAPPNPFSTGAHAESQYVHNAGATRRPATLLCASPLVHVATSAGSASPKKATSGPSAPSMISTVELAPRADKAPVPVPIAPNSPSPPSPRPSSPKSALKAPTKESPRPLKSELEEAARCKNVDLYSASATRRKPIKGGVARERTPSPHLTLHQHVTSREQGQPAAPRARSNSDLDLLPRGRNPVLASARSVARGHGEAEQEGGAVQTRLLSPAVGVDEASLWCTFESFYALNAPSQMHRASSLVAAVIMNGTVQSLALYRNKVVEEMCVKYHQRADRWVSDVWPPKAVSHHILHSFYLAYDPSNADVVDSLVIALSPSDDRYRELQALLHNLCDRWHSHGACIEDWSGPYPRCLQLAHR